MHHSDTIGRPTVSVSTLGRFTVANTYEVTARKTSALAASINDENACYFDDSRPGGLVGHPGLVFSFQWHSRFMPDRPPEPAAAALGVHALVDIRFRRSFRQGDVITVQGQTLAIRQVAPGVLTVQRFLFRDSTGEIVAIMDNGGIVRTARTDGPDAQLADADLDLDWPTEDFEASYEKAVFIPSNAPHIYSECANLWNPIHTEVKVAQAAGLPGIILHGSATLLIALKEVTNHFLGGDPTRLKRLRAQFRAMVIPGEYVTVRCGPPQASEQGINISFEVLTHDGRVAIQLGLVEAL